MAYATRIVDGELTRRLKASGAVVIEGPKACGETETARQQAANEVLLDVDVAAQQAAAIDPRLVLDGATPRLIDEWQIVPEVWNHVRREVDNRSHPGQFILTGSATPADDVTRHTGGLRFARVRMRPMTLAELGRRTAEISLAGLLNGEPSRSPDPALGIHDLIEDIVRGHALRSTPTRHFADPSLAAAALGATPSTLLRDVNTLGLLFESLLVRDLRVYAQPLDAGVFHYRDQSGLEVDAIVDAGER